MSLIFGRLTQDFINFEGVDQTSTAAADFRKATALDASYLVYIGISLPLISFPPRR